MRWKLTLACAMVSAATGWTMARQYGQNFWQVEGTLIHTPLPGGEHLGATYTPPTPQTLIALVKSPRSLEAVTRELELPVPPQTLDCCLKVVKPYNADAVSLVLEWPDPDTGRKIIDRLMDLHASEVASLRSEKMKEGTEYLNDERERCQSRLDEIRSAHAELPGGNNPERLRFEWEFAIEFSDVWTRPSFPASGCNCWTEELETKCEVFSPRIARHADDTDEAGRAADRQTHTRRT